MSNGGGVLQAPLPEPPSPILKKCRYYTDFETYLKYDEKYLDVELKKKCFKEIYGPLIKSKYIFLHTKNLLPSYNILCILIVFPVTQSLQISLNKLGIFLFREGGCIYDVLAFWPLLPTKPRAKSP